MNTTILVTLMIVSFLAGLAGFWCCLELLAKQRKKQWIPRQLTITCIGMWATTTAANAILGRTVLTTLDAVILAAVTTSTVAHEVNRLRDANLDEDL